MRSEHQLRFSLVGSALYEAAPGKVSLDESAFKEFGACLECALETAIEDGSLAGAVRIRIDLLDRHLLDEELGTSDRFAQLRIPLPEVRHLLRSPFGTVRDPRPDQFVQIETPQGPMVCLRRAHAETVRALTSHVTMLVHSNGLAELFTTHRANAEEGSRSRETSRTPEPTKDVTQRILDAGFLFVGILPEYVGSADEITWYPLCE